MVINPFIEAIILALIGALVTLLNVYVNWRNALRTTQQQQLQRLDNKAESQDQRIMDLGDRVQSLRESLLDKENQLNVKEAMYQSCEAERQRLAILTVTLQQQVIASAQAKNHVHKEDGT